MCTVSAWCDNYAYALKPRCTGIVSIYVHEKGNGYENNNQ